MRLGTALAVAGLATSAAAEVVERGVPVRMRDGVVLRADLRRPDGPGPFPTLVYRTPYGRGAAQREFPTFSRAAAAGYAVVIQDVRGRYDSEGEFEPYRNERRDGYDTIEWAAAQPWSNGRVGSFGLSYPGAVQWLAAVESPPHLRAMVPAMTYSTPRNFIYSGGVFDCSWLGWIWLNIAPDARARKGLPGPRSDAEAEREWQKVAPSLQDRLPLLDLHEFEDVAPYLFDWMRTPPGDPRWDDLELRDKYARVKAAVLNLSGWHDEAYGPEGATTNHLGLVASRRGEDPRSQLVIGPWTHGAVIEADAAWQRRSGEREFGAAAEIDYDGLVLRFMDRHLRGLAAGPDAAVRLFVMGENAWREEPAWPPPKAQPTTFYLHGGSGGTGLLSAAPPGPEPAASRFVSDPLDPVRDPFAAAAGAHDYRDLVLRKDLLRFETAPLEADLRVLGPIGATIQLSSDAPDADLWLKLYDVAPDGTAYNLMSPGLDVLRASYRDGGPQRKLLAPGEVVALRYENLMTGNLFRRGHRIRVVLAASFAPHFSRNLQTGALETESKQARRATLSIHHDDRHLSTLVLPVLP